MRQEGWQGCGGKLLAVMGGRGMAGGAFCQGPSEALGNGGWSHVLMHPEFNEKNALPRQLMLYRDFIRAVFLGT